MGVYQFARILIGVHVVGTPCTEPFEFLGSASAIPFAHFLFQPNLHGPSASSLPRTQSS